MSIHQQHGIYYCPSIDPPHPPHPSLPRFPSYFAGLVSYHSLVYFPPPTSIPDRAMDDLVHSILPHVTSDP